MSGRSALRGACIPSPRRFVALVTTAAAALSLVMAMVRREEWVGWLPTTVGVMEQATVWVPSIVAVAAAWVSGQPRAHGLADWVSTSPRSAADRLKVPVLMAGLVGLVAQGIALAVVLVVSAEAGLSAGGLSGFALTISVPTMSAYLLFWAFAGSAMGIALPRAVALPVTALVPYALYAALELYAGDSPLNVLAVNTTRSYDYVMPATGPLIARLVFWLFAAAVAGAALLGRRRLAQTGAWAVSFSAAFALFVGPAYVPIAGAEATRCEGHAPRTCLDASHVTAMKRYRSAVSRVWPSVPVALRPDTLVSDDLLDVGGAGSVLIAPPVAGYADPARVVDQTMFAARLGDALFMAHCTDSTGGVDTARVLVQWWRVEHDVATESSAFAGDTGAAWSDPEHEHHVRQAQALASLNPRRREEWFAANVDAIRGCNASTLPGSS
ncbi:hypothetical protein [Cellulomonas sp. URHD0024]|uniref:hypothetical protein n=1 Tax=Cellulomonas sp. URHD0024 TaxID=1302620 RepID=UPI000417E000|nr:hypothetical protein [Cellulomonas sp. URHD0024]